MDNNGHLRNYFTGCWLVGLWTWLSYAERQDIVSMIEDVSDWLSYADGALINVADSAGSTVVA